MSCRSKLVGDYGIATGANVCCVSRTGLLLLLRMVVSFKLRVVDTMVAAGLTGTGRIMRRVGWNILKAEEPRIVPNRGEIGRFSSYC